MAQVDIKAHLDLVLLALEALTGVGSEGMLQVATQLQLSTILTDRITLWRLRQSSPLRKGKGGRKKLDIEEALALVRVSAQLASQSQAQIRKSVSSLEKCANQKIKPHTDPHLGDYLDRFHTLYTDRMQPVKNQTYGIEELAIKLLVDLLFYSSKAGAKHLWISLLNPSNF